jgi:hypothetical protein
MKGEMIVEALVIPEVLAELIDAGASPSESTMHAWRQTNDISAMT